MSYSQLKQPRLRAVFAQVNTYDQAKKRMPVRHPFVSQVQIKRLA